LQIYWRLVNLGLLALVAASAIVRAQPAATLSTEALLRDRLGVAPADVARFTAGEILAATVRSTAPDEIAAAGAMRTAGDGRRLILWVRDIESFMRATGSVNVGAFSAPATAAEFARVPLDDVDFADLAACRPGRCEIRMPPAYLDRFQKEVNWKAPDARTQAAGLARALAAEYAAAYQEGGDKALGAFHNQQQPNRAMQQFQDMLRRSTKVWDLAYPFVSYLETFPGARPAGLEDRFYWTRDAVGRKPVFTLHHVAIQELADGRVLVADKQFYATREIDAALVIALGIPTADFKSFDLIVSVKARAEGISGVAGRVLRGRIEKEMTAGLTMYLEWIRASFKL
jgi:hypothetical protein